MRIARSQAFPKDLGGGPVGILVGPGVETEGHLGLGRFDVHASGDQVGGGDRADIVETQAG